MEQLKLENILSIYFKLQEKGMKKEDILKLPIYIGDDDELNGIHSAWFCQDIDKNSNNESDKYLIELINEGNGIKLKGKGILIS